MTTQTETRAQTKVEIYDFAWGGFRDLMGLGAEHAGFFSSKAAAVRYSQNYLTPRSNGAIRITTTGAPSFVLRKIGSRIVRTTA